MAYLQPVLGPVTEVVTGLLTGSDLLLGRADKDLGDQRFSPRCCCGKGTPFFLNETIAPRAVRCRSAAWPIALWLGI